MAEHLEHVQHLTRLRAKRLNHVLIRERLFEARHQFSVERHALVGLPGAPEGMKAEDPTIATLLKPLGYATGQFGKNHLGDRDEMLPTANGFHKFCGNLYHLNAEEESENIDYPKNPEFKKKFGPRGVIHSWAMPDGTQKIEDTGPLSKHG